MGWVPLRLFSLGWIRLVGIFPWVSETLVNGCSDSFHPQAGDVSPANKTTGWWQKQYCPCLCEGVASRRPATPSHKHGLCPPFGFQQAFMRSIAGPGDAPHEAGDAPHEGLLKVERREFRCLGFRCLQMSLTSWETLLSTPRCRLRSAQAKGPNPCSSQHHMQWLGAALPSPLPSSVPLQHGFSAQ